MESKDKDTETIEFEDKMKKEVKELEKRREMGLEA